MAIGRKVVLHSPPRGLVYDRRHAALLAISGIVIDSHVLLAPQHLVDARLRPGLAFASERPGDGRHRIAHRAALGHDVIDAPHDRGLVLVDAILTVHDVIAVQLAPVGSAVHGVTLDATAHVFRELPAVVFREPLEQALHQHALRSVADALGGAHQLHATALELRAVDGCVVAIAGKAIQFVHDDALESALLGIREHALERRAGVGRGAHGPVGVDLAHPPALGVGVLAADALLVLDGLLALLRAAKAGVDDGVHYCCTISICAERWARISSPSASTTSTVWMPASS